MTILNSIKKELGVRNGKLAELARKPNCVSTQTEQASKKVEAIAYSIDKGAQLVKAERAILAMPGAVIKQKAEGYLYAVFTTKLMRFKDDVEIYLDDETKLMHFRSASRLGYSDLGVNKKRYEAFSKLVSL